MKAEFIARFTAAAERADWRDPLRMTIAAVLSLMVSKQLGLPEGFWSVLTALVITRPHLGGTLRAGAGRLAGTLCGAGLASVIALGRHWHPPELLLLVCVLVPLGFLIAFKPEFRTAPVAAIIVLSASPLGHSPLHAAGLRITEIALGALIGSLVSWLVFPIDSKRHCQVLAAGLLRKLAAVFGQLQTKAGDDTEIDAAIEQCRRDLRALAGEARVAPWMRRQVAQQEKFVKLTTRLGGDAFFAIRMLRSQAAGQPLDESGRLVAAELQQMLLLKAESLGKRESLTEAVESAEAIDVNTEARAAARRATQHYVVGLLKRDLRQLGGG
jgi:uncharacterized membrane protein YccC